MPSNFNQTFQEVGVPDVTVPYQGVDPSSLLHSAAQDITQLGKQVKEYRDDQGLAETQDALTKADEEGSQYYSLMGELERAKAMSDDQNLGDINNLMQTVRMGQVQGSLTPSDFNLRLDNIIKTQVARYPHLAPQIRAMANMTRGNVHAVASEYGQDPELKAAKDVLERAAKRQVTPATIINEDNANAVADNLLKAKNLQIATNTLDLTSLMSYANRRGVLAAQQAIVTLRDQFSTLTANGQNPTDSQVDAWMNNIKQSVIGPLMSDVMDSAYRGGINLTKDNQDTIINQVNQWVDRVGADLKGRGTLEAKTKALKAYAENVDANAEWTSLQGDSYLAGVLRSAGSPQSRQMIRDSMQTLEGMAQRLARADMTPDQIRTQMETYVAGTQGPQRNPTMTAFNVMLNSGAFNTYMGEASVLHLDGDSLETHPVPPEVKAATRAFTYKAFIESPREARQAILPSYTSGMTWDEIFTKPTLVGEINQNPAVLQSVISKAVSETAEYIPDATTDPVVMDLTRGTNPFYYKNITPSSYSFKDIFGASPIEKLNERYKEVVDTFGAAGGKLFVDELHDAFGLEYAPGTAPSTPSAPDKKKVEPTSGAQAIVDKVIGFNSASFGLPQAMVMALMDQESSLGRKMIPVDPKTGKRLSSARGPLQIVKGTFEGVNKAKFGGQLNWDNEEDVIRASLAHLADLYETAGGDLVTVFKRWYGHTDPAKNDAFASSVLAKMKNYG